MQIRFSIHCVKAAPADLSNQLVSVSSTYSMHVCTCEVCLVERSQEETLSSEHFLFLSFSPETHILWGNHMHWQGAEVNMLCKAFTCPSDTCWWNQTAPASHAAVQQSSLSCRFTCSTDGHSFRTSDAAAMVNISFKGRASALCAEEWVPTAAWSSIKYVSVFS